MDDEMMIACSIALGEIEGGHFDVERWEWEKPT
jgi:hypothetical protein